MNLADFAAQEEIFIDANIFTYFALGTAEYQESCAGFLRRVELLLSTDALHVAICLQHGIGHCATADAHFERVDLLEVWTPAKA